MLATEVQSALARSTSQVVEWMFFSEALPSGEPSQTAQSITSTIPFQASFAGSLSLEVAQPTAQALAAAFLGLEQSDPAAHAHAEDTVGELASMICGRFLSGMEARGKLHMDAPEVGEVSDSGNVVRQDFDLAYGRLTVVLQLQ